MGRVGFKKGAAGNFVPRVAPADGRLTDGWGVRTIRFAVTAFVLPRTPTLPGLHFRLALCVLSVMGLLLPAQAANKTRYVILVTTDGLRQEEVFQGAEEILIS